MGKRRKRNRKRSQAAKLKAKFTAFTHQQLLNEAIQYEEHKETQTSYSQRVAELERGILSRTLFVSGVRDLKQQQNLGMLERFFSAKYGPVEACFVTSYGKSNRKSSPRGKNDYPPARVRFSNEMDCKKVLDDAGPGSLLQCPVIGTIHGNKIKVGVSKKYEGITEKVLGGSTIQFSASGFALGHWFRDDMFANWLRTYNDGTDEESTALLNEEDTAKPRFLEEYKLVNASDLQVNIELASRKLIIKSGNDCAEIRFKDVEGVIDVGCSDDLPTNEDKYSLLLTLKRPPKLMSLPSPELFDVFEFILGNILLEESYSRSLKFGSLKSDDFGRCLSLKISLHQQALDTLLLSNVMVELQKFGLFSSIECVNHRMNAVDYNLQRRNSKIIERELSLSLEDLHKNDPRLGFMIRSLLDLSKFCWYHALQDRFSKSYEMNIFKLLMSGLYPSYASYEALVQISKAVGRTKYPCRMFCYFVDCDVEEEILPEHCVSIPRLLLTPCRLSSQGFETETSNRVVRNFIKEKKFANTSFVRLHIGEEDGQRLFGVDLTPSVTKRIRDTIMSGVYINGKLYSFLAYSSSQLKEASVWMVSLEKRWTITKMRAYMGNFSQCKTPSKYAARIGQCFSTTFQGLYGRDAPIKTGQRLRHIEIEDIKSDFPNVPHSDGNGLITKEDMEKLLQTIPAFSTTMSENTSVVEIRYGGAKGILVAWDSSVIKKVQNTLYSMRSCDLVLRNSMIKFDAPFEFLEVCRIGSNVPYYLNRNVILLLKTHGVHDNYFLTQQQKMIADLESMLQNPDVVINLIPQLGGPDQRQRMRLMHTLYSGMSPHSDPFLFCCCMAIRSHHLFGLRKKSRIFVEMGAVLIGGIDESKLLPEYCVFLQISKRTNLGDLSREDEKEEFAPIVGPVMVTKHPVMHPGDVRMLLAVDIPELRGHKNVLLFSQHGNRPESNKMSGSDLDGDEYAITWDPALFLGEWNTVQKREDGTYVSKEGRALTLKNLASDAITLQHANHEPLDYTSAADIAATHLEIGDLELIEHFINFARNDCLGRIATLWQDWASKKGADCAECIILARLHSIAVDFAKSGVAAVIPDEVKWKGTTAHWREKKAALSHHCTSVIGQLYDRATQQNEKRIHNQYPDGLAGRKVDRYGQILTILEHSPRKHLQRNYMPQIPTKLGWMSVGEGDINEEQDLMFALANDQRLSYEDRILEIMNKYHLRNEGELFTGCIRKYNKLHKRKQHDVSEEVRRQCAEVCDDFRAAFFEQVLELSGHDEKVDGLNDLLSTVSLSGTNGAQQGTDDEVDDEAESMRQLIAHKALVDKTCKANPSFKIIREKGRKLAAAYYISTYSPSRELYRQSYALFSFPWIIADVIAHGLHDE